MNPAFLDGMSWEMAEVYGAISDQILINLAKYFPYYKPGATVPKSAFTYQSMMLAQFGQVNAETVAIIRRGLKDANTALGGVLEQAIIDSVRTAEKPLYKAVKQGIFSPPLVPIVSPNQTRAFQLYYAQACDKLNLVNTVMLESTGSAYRQAVNDVVSEMQINDRIKKTQTALDIGAGETATGVSSWNQALRHTVERMKQTGITGFVDHANHHWSAEAYAAMDIRTTVWNTSRAAVWETNQNFGNDLYSVSFHNGARPGCYDWQNRVISSTNNARTVTDLDGNEIYVVAQSDTSYGQAAGLFGVNCKHYPTPFIPGVSIIRGQPQSPEENERTYAESQEQRRLERKLREEKRDIMMAKAQGASDEEIKALQARARNTSQDIDDFCESTGRTRHRDREGVYTQRSFPSKDSYDVSQFENEQKKKIDQFYQNGGAQRQYQAGVMDGNATQTPPAQGTPTALDEISGYKDRISSIEQQIKASESEYSDLFTRSITEYGTDNYPEIEKALNEAGEKTSALYAEIEAERKRFFDYLYTPGEVDAREVFGEIRGSHTMRKDANAVNRITADLASQNNCGYCSLAYDARRRGIDCRAVMVYGSNDMVLPNNWEGAKMTSTTAYYPHDAANQIKGMAQEWGKGARGIVEVDWSNVRGHYFMFEVDKNGVCQFVDPQTGVIGKGAETLFDNAVPGSVKFCRTDDKPLTKQALLFLEKGGYTDD